jgi:putative SOS response-associated peptidase YedK
MEPDPAIMRLMCGRFVQAQSGEEYALHFGAAWLVDDAVSPSWNVAPTDRVYAVAVHEGRRALGTFLWGLVPWFAHTPKVGSRHINARAETLATKPAFKDSFTRRRCIVPADGFYEWEPMKTGGKRPHFVHAADGSPLALAGLWASWRDESGERLTTCSIVTTRPNDLVGGIHDRMPAILPPAYWERWLDPGFDDVDALAAMLGPAPDGSLAEYAVPSLVNHVRNNFPELIEPLR